MRSSSGYEAGTERSLGTRALDLPSLWAVPTETTTEIRDGLEGERSHGHVVFPSKFPEAGPARVLIENLRPEIDGGRFGIKRTVGESVAVTADIFADGHDAVAAVIRYRHMEDEQWSEAWMQPRANDIWTGSFHVERVGTYFYTIEGWINRFASWRRDLEKKFTSHMDVRLELESGVELIREALENARAQDRTEIESAIKSLSPASPMPVAVKVRLALSDTLATVMKEAAPRKYATIYDRELRVQVDPELGRFGAWYELFPRSCSPDPNRQGTLNDCAAHWLPRIADMGFDVLYLPPVHPIGTSFRKGKNNRLELTPGDPGSPWAIGSADGGHKSVDPALGTLEDFRQLVDSARELRVEVALDIAFQCSPDHPYVHEHPQWFKHRADGSIQYAENPPKKYQDIFPLDFETEDWAGLWRELKSIFEFWIEQGVHVFRVDNPHTKSFRFWAWCLTELKSKNPNLIFLAEAFTRPKLMYGLAKLGFTQSYNYFPWRNTKSELTEYFTELTRTDVREFFRPILWPNTPDILSEYLQFGGQPAFAARLVLAATLGASYGVYGPPFERIENAPREPGSEEYLNSEKYEIRHWSADEGTAMRELMTRLNQIRRSHPALQSDRTLQFHEIDNEQLIAYSKHAEAFEEIILTVVNLDPRHTHRGWVRLNRASWGLKPTGTYQAHELLTNERYVWSGERNFIELNPAFIPAHIFRLRRYVRTENDFDYFV